MTDIEHGVGAFFLMLAGNTMWLRHGYSGVAGCAGDRVNWTGR